MKVKRWREATRGRIGLPRGSRALPADRARGVGAVEQERPCWDPKDGELCLGRSKPEETLVEDRSDSDVQIDRPIWV